MQPNNQSIVSITAEQKYTTEHTLQLFTKFQKNYDNLCQRIQQDKYLNIYLEKAQLNKDILLQSLRKIKSQAIKLKELLSKQKNKKSIVYLLNYLNYWITSRQSKNDIKLAAFALEVECKLKVSLKILNTVFTFSDSSITHDIESKKNPAWKFIQFDNLGTPDKIKSLNNQLKQMINAGISAKMSMDNQKSWVGKQLMHPWAFSKYILNPDWAKIKCYNFNSKPNLQFLQSNTDMLQGGVIRQITKLTHPSISHHYKLWIPRQKTDQKVDIFELNHNAVHLRIHSSKKIYFSRENQKVSPDKKSEKIKKIIVYFHGGGFIMGSTFMMQHITRKWANKLKIPIISVDYRKPPQHRFPVGPYDCYRAYEFIVTQLQNYCVNFQPQTILLAGDSAGGNLALGVTGLALKNKLQPPKGLFLIYPSTDFRFTFTPSKMNCFEDPILSINILDLIYREYLKSPQQQTHPLASPVLMSQQFVNGKVGNENFPSNWPQTSIIVGQKDPLFDDSLHLIQRMVESDVKCKLRIYTNFYHNFYIPLNYDYLDSFLTYSIDEMNRMIQAVPREDLLRNSKNIDQQQIISKNYAQSDILKKRK